VTSMNAETDSKRLGLLKEALPKLRRVGVVWSPVDPSGSAVMSAAEGAARSLGLQLEPLAMRRPEDLSEAFATAKKQARSWTGFSRARSPRTSLLSGPPSSTS
jgi:putative ABC transport system substrate-binding protein